MNRDTSAMRRDYQARGLDEADVAADPIVQFGNWFADARADNPGEANAMTLATVGADGRPAARVVLLKDFGEHGFTFFTNYESRKGVELAGNQQAALLFWWSKLERQVRIEGTTHRLDAAASDAYFASRPEGSRIGACASPQSRVIANRDILQKRVAEIGASITNGEIARPAHWGGYCLVADRIEFWQGRTSRLHDRLRYRLDNGVWIIERLAP